MDLKLAKKILNSIKWSMNRNKISQRPVKDIILSPQDIIEIYNKQEGKCYWTNVNLDTKYNYIAYHPLAMSADRRDNTQPYVKDNIVLTMRILNLGRREFPENEFPKVIDHLMENFAVQYLNKKEKNESNCME